MSSQTHLPLTPRDLDFLMAAALEEAKAADAAGEVPVGAVVSHNQTIIGRGRNQTEEKNCVINHAEILALREASERVGNWRLSECILCVTLEPCTMCLGAIRLARIPVVVFGAGDSRQGALGSLYDLSQDSRLGSPLRVIQGVREAESLDLLRSFFQKVRG